MAELWGVYYGLVVAWERRVERLEFEVDLEIVVGFLTTGISEANPLSSLHLSETKHFILAFDLFSLDPIFFLSFIMVYELAADYNQVKDELLNPADEVIISLFLKRMIVYGDSWPELFTQDVDVFNKNPNVEFNAEIPIFVIVKPRTESCGKTDGCRSGCWRIMGRDKLIKSEETGEILGFKKIYKFCLKRQPEEYKRSWVMEEYRLTNNLNRKQDHVICKIRFLFRTEISFLLGKHFSYLSTIPANLLLPSYGYYDSDSQVEDESYLLTISDSDGNVWPSYVTNNVYRLHPLTLVDPSEKMFRLYGTCIYANETFRTTDECDGSGYWKILHGDKLIKSKSGKTIGFKKGFGFYQMEELSYVREGEDVKVTWTIKEYRLKEEEKQNKVLCVIKLTEL
ncbi:PREDICTED: uncharacterized protein LOC104789347 [Camelina sativa]|uniref:Uncharacterized protein LOC104789347 n=1 Tax=Camelina sativa TaxID=90675 RepID=A0ABM1RPB6_CAMSA|nr:PREDICTED: uncharacterized protein LOC104789347 [Camelina sativa]